MDFLDELCRQKESTCYSQRLHFELSNQSFLVIGFCLIGADDHGVLENALLVYKGVGGA